MVRSDRCERKVLEPGVLTAPPAAPYEWAQVEDEHGLVLRDHAMARQLLKLNEGTVQAGFQAERLLSLRGFRQPMLYQEGETHRRQRRATARFFTPRTITASYEGLMTGLAEQLVGELERRGEGRVDEVAFRMAMSVVAEVVGLTDSHMAGMQHRLQRFFEVPNSPTMSRPQELAYGVRNLRALLVFHVMDVLPAIRSHRRRPRPDVITHLLDSGVKPIDILTEVLTFAAAGMVTTRQFIPMALWHLIERDDLRERFLVAGERERLAILSEIIRLESVAGHLRRRTTADLVLDGPDGPVPVPAGTIIDIHVASTNADERALGAHPLTLDADRCPARGVSGSGLSFGAGPHQCPGEYLALHETDILLRRLLRNEVSIVQEPDIRFDSVVRAYDLGRFVIRLTPRPQAPGTTSASAGP